MELIIGKRITYDVTDYLSQHLSNITIFAILLDKSHFTKPNWTQNYIYLKSLQLF